MSDDYIYVAFRSKETGRYIFHLKWRRKELDMIKAAAELRGETLEEFISAAIYNAYPSEGWEIKGVEDSD